MTEPQPTQTAPASASPASTGVDIDKIKEEIKAQFEREKQGLVKDLQTEREKRHQLEAQMQAAPSVPTPAAPGVASEPNADAQLEQIILPVVQKAVTLQERAKQAFAFIAKEEGLSIDPSEVPNHPVFKEYLETAKKYEIGGKDPLKEAMVLAELRRRDKKEAEEKAKAEEAARNAAISGNASVSSTAPVAPATGGKVWTASEVRNMPSSEWPKYREEILKAQAEGRYDRSK